MSPRYAIRLNPDDGQTWQVIDQHDDDDVMCNVSSKTVAQLIAQELNRGICESVTPNGRWAE